MFFFQDNYLIAYVNLLCALYWQEDELKGAVVLVYANKQVKKQTIFDFLYTVLKLL